MKTRIVRFSPHQNGKVVAILSAVVVTVFSVPFALILMLAEQNAPPGSDFNAPPVWMFLIFPILYLIFGYITTVIYCALYNLLIRVTGGFEFEARNQDS